MIFERRHIAAGEEWIGYLCVNPRCGMPILIGPISPDMLDETGTIRLRGRSQRLTCPHCQKRSVYRTRQARRFRAEQIH
jgi:hypothetical protein